MMYSTLFQTHTSAFCLLLLFEYEHHFCPLLICRVAANLLNAEMYHRAENCERELNIHTVV
jgi:hypothetical protein